MTVVVVGNPKPMSRTHAAADLAADLVATKLTGEAPTAVIHEVDLGASLLGWGTA
jgi:FMN reductase